MGINYCKPNINRELTFNSEIQFKLNSILISNSKSVLIDYLIKSLAKFFFKNNTDFFILNGKFDSNTINLIYDSFKNKNIKIFFAPIIEKKSKNNNFIDLIKKKENFNSTTNINSIIISKFPIIDYGTIKNPDYHNNFNLLLANIKFKNTVITIYSLVLPSNLSDLSSLEIRKKYFKNVLNIINENKKKIYKKNKELENNSIPHIELLSTSLIFSNNSIDFEFNDMLRDLNAIDCNYVINDFSNLKESDLKYFTQIRNLLLLREKKITDFSNYYELLNHIYHNLSLLLISSKSFDIEYSIDKIEETNFKFIEKEYNGSLSDIENIVYEI
jgi:hypothetical protein